RVISWIWVSACTRPISTPTINEAIMIGPASVSTRSIAAWARTRASSALIGLDLHPHDFAIGADHAVADRDYGVERRLGRADGSDHVDQIAFSGDLQRGGLLGRTHALGRIAHQAFDHAAETAGGLATRDRRRGGYSGGAAGTQGAAIGR